MIYAEDLAIGTKYSKYTSRVSDLLLNRYDHSRVLNQDIHFSMQNGMLKETKNMSKSIVYLLTKPIA